MAGQFSMQMNTHVAALGEIAYALDNARARA